LINYYTGSKKFQDFYSTGPGSLDEKELPLRNGSRNIEDGGRHDAHTIK